MMRSIAMILGTILAILFLIQLFRGQKYEELVEGLEEKDFPLKDIYTVGFCWAELPPLRLRGVLFERLEQNAKVGLIGTNGITIGDMHRSTLNTTPESYELQKTFKECLDAGCEYVVMEVSSQAVMLKRIEGINV